MYADVSEVMALADDMERNASTVPGRARTVVQKGGHDTVAVMQAGTRVDTGFLVNSEGVDFDDDGLGFAAGPTAEYGGYVEEGTSRMHAEPYAGPAADQVFPNIEAALGDVAEGMVGRA